MEKRYQVFISSTFEDLKDERNMVKEIIINRHCFPSGMELFPATDTEQFEYIKKIIDQSDYYIIIVAGNYGSIANDGISFTEKEFDYAWEKEIPILAFIKKDINTIPANKVEIDKNKREKLEAFREKTRTGRVVRYWDSLHELKDAIYNSLLNEFETNPREGWIRGNVEHNESLKQIDELKSENQILKLVINREKSNKSKEDNNVNGLNLEAKRAFNKLVYEFQNNNYNLYTISQIVDLVRLYKHNLSINQIRRILQIPYEVLKSDVELIDESRWVLENSIYFADNVHNENEEFNQKWKNVFENKFFNLETLVDFFEDILSQLKHGEPIDDFCLRNIEVTLRDDVKLKNYRNFEYSGDIFAKEIVETIL